MLLGKPHRSELHQSPAGTLAPLCKYLGSIEHGARVYGPPLCHLEEFSNWKVLINQYSQIENSQRTAHPSHPSPRCLLRFLFAFPGGRDAGEWWAGRRQPLSPWGKRCFKCGSLSSFHSLSCLIHFRCFGLQWNTGFHHSRQRFAFLLRKGKSRESHGANYTLEKTPLRHVKKKGNCVEGWRKRGCVRPRKRKLFESWKKINK